MISGTSGALNEVMPQSKQAWFSVQRYCVLGTCLLVILLIFLCRLPLLTWIEAEDSSGIHNNYRSQNILGINTVLGESKRDPKCYCVDSETEEWHLFCHSLASQSTDVKKFNCTYLSYLKKLDLLNPQYESRPQLNGGQVFVTGASSNHFSELVDHLGTLIKLYGAQPNTKIIAYDFGLDEMQAALIKSACKVEYRNFDFSKYPNYVRQMFNYRWKPLVIAELLMEFDAFWWGDSSIRWSADNLTFIYDAVNKQQMSPYLLVDRTGHSVLAATNPKMFNYLSSNRTRLEATEMFGGGFAFVARSKLTATILKWSVLCALEPACMEPPGSGLTCHWVNGDPWKHYANCHRYDQSAINVILANFFDFNIHRYTTKDMAEFAKVERGSVGQYQLKPC